MESNEEDIRFTYRYTNGLGQANCMYIDIHGFLLSLYSNRCYAPNLDPYKLSVVMNTPDHLLHTLTISERGYHYPPAVYKCIKMYQKIKDKEKVYFGEEPDWRSENISYIKNPLNKEILNISQLHYPIFLYSRKEINNFINNYFGDHLIYIIGNYFTRIPEEAITKTLNKFNKFPKNTQILAAHIRARSRPNDCYLISFEDQIKKLIKFLDKYYEKFNGNIRVLICSDNSQVVSLAKQWKHSDLIIDGDPDPMIDLSSFIAANERVLTARSTYSIISANLIAKPSWFVDMMSDYMIPQYHSQGLLFDPIYHIDTVCVGQASMHLHLESDTEEIILNLFKKFGI